MNNKSGFTLVEIMVALACMVGALSVTIHLSMTLYRSWQQTAKAVQTRVALHAALDTIRRDLEHAPQECVQWYQTGLYEVVWHTYAVHAYALQNHTPSNGVLSDTLRLSLVKGRLERCEGSYDKRTHTWHTRSVSVLAQGIKELRVRLYHKDAAHYNAADVVLVSFDGVQEQALIAIGVGALS